MLSARTALFREHSGPPVRGPHATRLRYYRTILPPTTRSTTKNVHTRMTCVTTALRALIRTPARREFPISRTRCPVDRARRFSRLLPPLPSPPPSCRDRYVLLFRRRVALLSLSLYFGSSLRLSRNATTRFRPIKCHRSPTVSPALALELSRSPRPPERFRRISEPGRRKDREIRFIRTIGTRTGWTRDDGGGRVYDLRSVFVRTDGRGGASAL